MSRSRSSSLLVASLFVLHTACCLPALAGEVLWSDGKREEGVITFASGSRLTVNADGRWREMDPALVREIRMIPEREELDRPWRMPEPGNPRKEYLGTIYPVRHLLVEIVTDDGATVRGHLQTCVLYRADADGRNRKLVLSAKQRGEQGQTLAQLAYPQRVVIGEPGHPAVPRRLHLPAGAATPAEVVALSGAGLQRSEGKPQADGAWTLDLPLAAPAFVAARSATTVTVAWPAAPSSTHAGVVQAVRDADDFMDQREVLASADLDGQTWALLMLRRVGSSTIGGAERPWRLEVWRFVPDTVGGALLLAGHAHLYRGVLKKAGDPLPSVEVKHTWWPAKSTEDGHALGR